MNKKEISKLRKLKPNCKKVCVEWYENHNVEYYESLQDFCNEFDISYSTGQRWIHNKVKIKLPFKITYTKISQ